MGDVLKLRNERLVQEALGERPDTAQEQAVWNAKAKILDAHAPSLIKKGREAAKAEVQHVVDAGAKAVAAPLIEAHAKELQSLALHMQDTIAHVRGSNFWRGVAVAGSLMLLVAVGGVYGAYRFGVETQLNTVAAMNAVRAPRGLQLPAPDPSEQGFR